MIGEFGWSRAQFVSAMTVCIAAIHLMMRRTPEPVRALRDLGAFAVVQPGVVHHLGAAVEPLVAGEATWPPFRDLLDAGVPLATSSDDWCASTSRCDRQRSALRGARVVEGGARFGDSSPFSYRRRCGTVDIMMPGT